MWKEVNEQNVLPIPEHRAHHFPYRQRLFEFRPDWRSVNAMTSAWFPGRNALYIQELYHRPNLAGGGRRNNSFHSGSLLPRYGHEVGLARLVYD
ncbi:hypothetical protein TNCV_1480921 [Trichonephila clavipes]|nr:hypothetical protein TNCV_1480921 [Trichonephila clavipes]